MLNKDLFCEMPDPRKCLLQRDTGSCKEKTASLGVIKLNATRGISQPGLLRTPFPRVGNGSPVITGRLAEITRGVRSCRVVPFIFQNVGRVGHILGSGGVSSADLGRCFSEPHLGPCREEPGSVGLGSNSLCGFRQKLPGTMCPGAEVILVCIMDAHSPRCWAGRLSGPSERGSLLCRASVSLGDAAGPQKCWRPLDLGRGFPLWYPGWVDGSRDKCLSGQGLARRVQSRLRMDSLPAQCARGSGQT